MTESVTVPVIFVVTLENRTAKLLTAVTEKKPTVVILNFRFILTKHSSQIGRYSRPFMAVLEYCSGLPSTRKIRPYCRKSSKKPLRPLRDWSISPTRKSWERWDCLAWRRKGLKGWNLHKHLKGGCKADGTRLFSVVPRNRAKGSVCKLNIREHFLTVREAKQWKRLQGGCGGFILGHIQKPSGHGPLATGSRSPRQVNDCLRGLVQRARKMGLHQAGGQSSVGIPGPILGPSAL